MRKPVWPHWDMVLPSPTAVMSTCSVSWWFESSGCSQQKFQSFICPCNHNLIPGEFYIGMKICLNINVCKVLDQVVKQPLITHCLAVMHPSYINQ